MSVNVGLLLDVSHSSSVWCVVYALLYLVNLYILLLNFASTTSGAEHVFGQICKSVSHQALQSRFQVLKRSDPP